MNREDVFNFSAGPSVLPTEVLQTAESFSANPVCRGALDYLKRTLDALSNYGLDDYISVDLGMEESVESLQYFRSQLVLASRLAGIAAPVDGVTTTLEPVARRQGT